MRTRCISGALRGGQFGEMMRTFFKMNWTALDACRLDGLEEADVPVFVAEGIGRCLALERGKARLDSPPDGNRVSPAVKRDNDHAAGLKGAAEPGEGFGRIVEVADDLVDDDDVEAVGRQPSFEVALGENGRSGEGDAGESECLLRKIDSVVGTQFTGGKFGREATVATTRVEHVRGSRAVSADEFGDRGVTIFFFGGVKQGPLSFPIRGVEVGGRHGMAEAARGVHEATAQGA